MLPKRPMVNAPLQKKFPAKLIPSYWRGPFSAPEELFVQHEIQDQLDRVGLVHLRIQVLQDE